MNARYLVSSSSRRICLSKASIIRRCYQTSSFDCFNKIKSLYNEVKEVDAIDEYFRNPNPFAASFLIARQDTIDMALKIYQAAKNSSSLNFFVTRTLINVLEKRNGHHMMIDALLDDSMLEAQKLQAKDIAKIKTTDWILILRNLSKCRRKEDAIKLTKMIQKFTEQNGKMDIILKNCLINMYGKCGHLDEAIKIFNNIKISERNVIIWTTMISAFIENEKGKEALEFFWKMQEEGIKPGVKIVTCVLKTCCESGLIDNAADIFFSIEKKLGFKPNEYHYNCSLTACADNGLLSLGKKIHKHITENNYPQNVILKTNILNMYGKCGNLEEAVKIFNGIKVFERDITTWTTMILAYGQHGRGKEAPELFDQMQHEGLLPNETTVIRVSNACSHSGPVQEALDIFHNLETKFKMKPRIMHCNCIVDALGRAGRLEDAEDFITDYMKKQQIKSNVITWCL